MFINLSTSFIIFFSYYIFFSIEFCAQCFPCFSSFLLLLSFSCSERLFFFFNFSVADTKLYMKHFALVRPLEVQQSNSLKAVISALPPTLPRFTCTSATYHSCSTTSHFGHYNSLLHCSFAGFLFLFFFFSFLFF